MSSMEQRVRSSFARQDFMQTLGVEMVSVTSGAVELRLPVRAGLLQQHGFVHAGAVSAMADTAAGYAALSMLPEGTDVLTVEFKINLLAPARGESLIARSRVVRSGRQLTVSACDVFAVVGSEEKCVATLLGTIAHR
jgi:uncharacterized protein (TIGR00369 family)